MDLENEALPCVDKIAFDTKKQAQAAATTVAYQHGSKVKPYQCRHCRLWHLSSDYSGGLSRYRGN